jgi:hypothetical protein
MAGPGMAVGKSASLVLLIVLTKATPDPIYCQCLFLFHNSQAKPPHDDTNLGTETLGA